MSNGINRPHPEDDHLTTKEAAAFLGMKPGTLNAYRSEQIPGKPPFVQYGHRVWYRKTALVKWMERQTVQF